MKNLSFLLIFVIAIGFWACDDNNDNPPEPEKEPPELKITSFRFEEFSPAVVAEIDTANLEIHALVPKSADIRSLTPTIEYTDSAELSPPSGYAYNFSSPLDFTLTLRDTSVTYTVYVDHDQSAKNELKSVKFPGLYRRVSVEDTVVTMQVPYGTDLTSIVAAFSISEHATVTPESGSTLDFSSPVTVTVIAGNGDEQQYTITLEEKEQATAVRAFWVPATWHSSFLRSYENIQEGVALADELNFNTLYIAAWSQKRTLYPSQALVEHSSYNTPEEALFNDYTGGSGDPLKDVIALAHEKDMKVILWYEYGFMAKWGTVPTAENDRILAVHPDWVGMNNNGEPANYNGSDYYYNAYDEEVQQFMIDLVMEAVENYNIDGIQGDDRLPAMPRNSGYESATVERYKAEHDGATPPDNYNQVEWVNWRADILNRFWKTLYDTVKSVKPNCLVTSSPNPYPWAYDNLMQDWPQWLEDGAVEILSVQCYRKSVSSYRYTVQQALNYFMQHSDGQKTHFAPGLLVYGPSGLTDPGLLAEQIKTNRENGITGEAFFYDEPLKRQQIQKLIKAFYPGEAKFPGF